MDYIHTNPLLVYAHAAPHSFRHRQEGPQLPSRRIFQKYASSRRQDCCKISSRHNPVRRHHIFYFMQFFYTPDNQFAASCPLYVGPGFHKETAKRHYFRFPGCIFQNIDPFCRHRCQNHVFGSPNAGEGQFLLRTLQFPGLSGKEALLFHNLRPHLPQSG